MIGPSAEEEAYTVYDLIGTNVSSYAHSSSTLQVSM